MNTATSGNVTWKLGEQVLANPVASVWSFGLTPANIADAVQQVWPFGVDVSSGVESAPGQKDAGLVRRFVEIVREMEQELG